MALSGPGCNSNSPDREPPTGQLVIDRSRASVVWLESESVETSTRTEGFASVVLTNVSPLSTKVRVAGRTCGCFSVFIDGSEVPVGSEFEIAPGARRLMQARPSGSPHVGSNPFVVDLEIESAGNETSRGIAFDTAVVRDLQAEPGSLHLPVGVITAQASSSTNVRVTRRWRGERPNWRPPQIDTSSPLIRIGDVWLADAQSDGADGVQVETWECSLSLEDATVLSSAVQRESVWIDSESGPDATTRRRISIPVVLRAVTGLVAPSRVSLGTASGSEIIRRRVTIRSADGESFQLLGVNCDPDVCEIMWNADNASATHLLQIRADPTILCANEQCAALLAVSTSRESDEPVEIQLTWHLPSE